VTGEAANKSFCWRSSMFLWQISRLLWIKRGLPVNDLLHACKWYDPPLLS